MKIEELRVFHLRLPLVHFFETSFGRCEEQETLIVSIRSEGQTGYGEVPAWATPSYSYETVHTAWHILRDFLAPRLKGRELSGPEPVSDLFAGIRGHPMAKAGLEMAVLDVRAKIENRPLCDLLGGTRKEIPTGISLGIEETLGDLVEQVEAALGRGYQRIKLKIRPGWDVNVLREIRRKFPAIPLMVDANGSYELSDVEHLKQLDEFGLMMLEQPLADDDYVDHAELQSALRTPICLDESIKSPADARRALDLGACRIINIKSPRVGGPTNARRIHDLAQARGVPVWCGGLLESGIGRAHNIALATLPNFILPGDISASERYFREDIIDPPVRVSARGTIVASGHPGIGYSVNEEKLARYRVRGELLST